MPQYRLELHASVPEGREREAALQFRAGLAPQGWKILAGIAAEIVSIHESQAAGETTVLVVPAAAVPDFLRRL
jgi:hypothetical protein